MVFLREECDDQLTDQRDQRSRKDRSSPSLGTPRECSKSKRKKTRKRKRNNQQRHGNFEVVCDGLNVQLTSPFLTSTDLQCNIVVLPPATPPVNVTLSTNTS
jgi:hypothetical protein